MGQVIFHLGKQIILTREAVEILADRKTVRQFTLCIREQEPSACEDIENAERKPGPDGTEVMLRLILLFANTRGIWVCVFTRPQFLTGSPVVSLPV